MKTALLAPLDWGLGHASRSLALVQRLETDGYRVVLAGSGASGRWMRMTRPDLPYVELPGFTLTYSRSKRQVWAVLRALPRLLYRSFSEHRALKRLVRSRSVDLVVSDNRFGLFCTACRCVYVTHQAHIFLPRPYRFLEPLAEALHRRVMERYDACWIPDEADLSCSLSGALGHPRRLSANAVYIGPLSRFRPAAPSAGGGTLWLLSGVEPQRTMLENELLAAYTPADGTVTLVRGVCGVPLASPPPAGLTVIDSPDTDTLGDLIRRADRIVARSGYSTVMDLARLGKLEVARWVPTPGQPEQEYLAGWLSARRNPA